MPNIKLFSRRKSSGAALDIAPEPSAPTSTPGQSSFRVIERPHKAPHTFDGRAPRKQPFNSPLQQLRGKSAENLGVALGANRSVEQIKSLDPNWALKRDRGSGGTTNSGSSGYYDSSAASARHSSSSTLPSSLDQEHEPYEEELFPRKSATTSMYQSVTADVDAPLPPPPSFKARAVRAISFGQKHQRTGSVPQTSAPSVPTSPVNGAPRVSEQSNSPSRDRSMTNSSDASTAVPTRLDPELSLGKSFGDDFGNMFAGFGKNKSREKLSMPPPPPPPVVGAFHRTVHGALVPGGDDANTQQESEPMFPPKTHSRQTFTPSPNGLRNARDETSSPYSFDARNSQDGLMSNSALSSPGFDDGPPVPAHSSAIAPAFLGKSRGYAAVPDRTSSPGLERTSSDEQMGYQGDQKKEREQGYNNRQTQLDDGDRWAKKVALRDPQEPSSSDPAPSLAYRTAPSNAASGRRQPGYATAGASRPAAVSEENEEDDSLFGTESRNATPRAAKLATHNFQEEPLFDSSPSGPASRAMMPGHNRTEGGTPKKMTKAQFDALQKSGESSLEHSEDDAHLADDHDDEDDVEHMKRITKQRRKQEANMAIYRQQMKKVTGGGPSDLPHTIRPSMGHSNSAPPGMHLGGAGGTPPSETIRGKQMDDEDDDVPLGILQAHGFPGGARPPMRLVEDPSQRKVSVAGSVMGGGAGQGNLPPFARRLPADPYFGSSLVNPANRESLAFSSAQSAYGGAPAGPQMGHPGGLVGVIAGEERAKAARRGSPNMLTGNYDPLPSNMPGMPRTMSMGSAMGPQAYGPGGYVPGMPMMMPPQDQTQQQMQQFMQMQMQFMQNMMAMQQQMGTPQARQPTPDFLGVPGAGHMGTHAPSLQGPMPNQGRAMTLMNPPPQWDYSQGPPRPTSAMPANYAPSVQGLNVPGGLGPGYTPSIAPSERSNVGMAPRYRPVQTNGDAGTGRSQSMTSSMTLQAFTNSQSSPNLQRVESGQDSQKSTIRIVDKPKGMPKVSSRQVDADEDEDEGWAEMAKKRSEKKFGRRNKDGRVAQEPALGDLYSSYK
ncbi:hypothetical protein LTR36_007140 [Oleoguttula mirabilis]|uniref:Uncharacterized protein n=1 Tax=Oleoguttula mirabilis TaxID=1507867 RepID=A0AAV9JBG1_9PEZI|nr:hypothetical protein LTR36_007140 [Oleoguttula mirabilis]